MMSKLRGTLLVAAATFFAGVARAGDFTPIDGFQDMVDTADDFAAAVPEPTALIAMGVGLATVAFAVRRLHRD